MPGEADAVPALLGFRERLILASLLDTLIPSDDLGPGATECGVDQYVGEALSWMPPDERSELIAGLAAVDAHTRLRFGAGLEELPPDQRAEIVAEIAENAVAGVVTGSHALLLTVRELALQGMFGDPGYGGNRAAAGWRLLGHPGPALVVSARDQDLDPPEESR
jgi:gluconate 2-dehydrogenase gamma chain